MLRYRIGRCLDAVAAPLKRILPHHAHREIDMVNGPVFSNVVRYSIPLILSGMLQLLYNMADVVVVGQFESTDAVASVTATSSLITLMVNLFIGLSVGTSVLVAQYSGANKYREIQDAVHTSIALSLVMGVLVGIFGVFMSHTFLVWMGTPEGNVLDGASLYMRIYFLGMPGNMLYNFGAAVMRSVGDTKRPLYYLSLAGVINIVLNIITVAFFGMGVAGVAIATIVSQYVSAVLVLLNLIRSHGSVHLDLKKLRIKKVMLGGIMKIGLPAGFSSIIFSISNVLIQSSINSFGANAMAGSGSASQLENFVYTAMNSIAQAALSFTGQNIGAQRYDRIAKIMRVCMLSVIVTGLVLGSLVTLLSEPLLALVYQGGSRSAGYRRCGAQRPDSPAHHLHDLFPGWRDGGAGQHAARLGQRYRSHGGDGGRHLRRAHAVDLYGFCRGQGIGYTVYFLSRFLDCHSGDVVCLLCPCSQER